MKRGKWWRVGISKLLAPYGCGVKSRAKTEGAEATWILSTHQSELEARCSEQVASVKYGIPTTHWRVGKLASVRDVNLIRSIYDRLDPNDMLIGAMRAITEHGRSYEYPFVDRSTFITKYSRRASMRIRSCNILPQGMAIPVPEKTGDDATWTPVNSVSIETYTGQVHSLAVAQLRHYIADGLITHNCFMGWVEGHRPPDYGRGNGERDQTTVWEIASVTNAEREAFGHSTPKPTELFRIPIIKHLKSGELCYEPFAGSCPQLVAAELTGRLCYALDIEPACVAIGLQRMADMGIEPRLLTRRNQGTLK